VRFRLAVDRPRKSSCIMATAPVCMLMMTSSGLGMWIITFDETELDLSFEVPCELLVLEKEARAALSV
jgi:hypothetical protein